MASEDQENVYVKPKKALKINAMPKLIQNSKSNSIYQKTEYLGRGAFAKCYKVVETETREVLAAKCIPKEVMKTEKHRASVHQEILIQKSLHHENIVQIHSVMQDSNFTYILLEYCEHRSLGDLLKIRKKLTVPEVRYFMYQIIKGTEYLHQHDIIHRDIKPSNIFLDKNLKVKIGDFGLAVKAKIHQRFYGMCGTPNYVSPEIILKTGHSFDCDIWSLGCVMYSLLVGTPPFQKSTIYETYDTILEGKFTIPRDLDSSAVSMIITMLNHDPELRPTPYQLLNHPFFTRSDIPQSLPFQCLSTAPEEFLKKPSEILKPIDRKVYRTVLIDIKKQVESLFKSKMEIVKDFNEKEKKVLVQQQSLISIWISKWIDYTKENGFAYELSNDITGVLYKDGKNLLISSDPGKINFIDEDGNEDIFDTDYISESLEEKLTVLKYYRNHMNEALRRTGPKNVLQGNVAHTKYMITYLRHNQGISMLLSNGTLQFNGWNHGKFLICPLKQTISIIEKETMKTYRYCDLRGKRISKCLYDNLYFAYNHIDEVINTLRK